MLSRLQVCGRMWEPMQKSLGRAWRYEAFYEVDKGIRIETWYELAPLGQQRQSASIQLLTELSSYCVFSMPYRQGNSRLWCSSITFVFTDRENKSYNSGKWRRNSNPDLRPKAHTWAHTEDQRDGGEGQWWNLASFLCTDSQEPFALRSIQAEFCPGRSHGFPQGGTAWVCGDLLKRFSRTPREPMT